MTKNQIEWNKMVEDSRHNQAVEAETNRNNMAVEKEVNRSNLAKEKETNRSNLANEGLLGERNRLQYQATIESANISAGAHMYAADQAAAASRYNTDAQIAFQESALAQNLAVQSDKNRWEHLDRVSANSIQKEHWNEIDDYTSTHYQNQDDLGQQRQDLDVSKHKWDKVTDVGDFFLNGVDTFANAAYKGTGAVSNLAKTLVPFLN